VSTLRTAVDEYLTVRRRLGFKLERAGRLLPEFVTYLERMGATTITSELALAWVRQTAEGPSNWRAERLGIVRSFARHLRGSDPSNEVPPASMVPRRTVRATPCRDTNVVDERGVIHDRLEMSWLRLPLATITITIQVDRSGLAPP
jgi:hypothetical protein